MLSADAGQGGRTSERAPGAYQDMHILNRVQSVLEGTAHARMVAHAAAELGIAGRPSKALPVFTIQPSLFEPAEHPTYVRREGDAAQTMKADSGSTVS